MNYYEELEEAVTRDGFTVLELPLQSGDGRCKGHRIAIREDIPTLKKKADALAEEYAHGKLTVGDISDLSIAENRKQERKARLMAYEIRFPLIGIVDAYKAHCTNAYEISEYLEVSEDTIIEALEYYRQIYGCKITAGKYVIQFEPYLQVGEIFTLQS